MRTNLCSFVGWLTLSVHTTSSLRAGSTGAASGSKPSAKPWVGRYAEFEECVRTSPVVAANYSSRRDASQAYLFPEGGLAGVGCGVHSTRSANESGVWLSRKLSGQNCRV